MKPFTVEIWDGPLRDTAVVTFPGAGDECRLPLLHHIVAVDPEDRDYKAPMSSILVEMTRRQWRILRQRLAAVGKRRLVLEIREGSGRGYRGTENKVMKRFLFRADCFFRADSIDEAFELLGRHFLALATGDDRGPEFVGQMNIEPADCSPAGDSRGQSCDIMDSRAGDDDPARADPP
jgi:hypothetical protein